MALASTDYPFSELMWTMLVFFCWVAWFWLLFLVLSDLYRRPGVSGWAKAGWTVFVLLLPFVGVLLYLGTQGRHMRPPSAVDKDAAERIAEAKRLLDQGAIDEEEFRVLKRKALSS
ncbi:SHOCT domain-containing protein [Amycolatopsis decaplanina]|uniref:Integral membrane protein n=1 Tax=Amycolatopsis decaplanina DSM 44594 TaxID=1284240 RepID=M2YWB5_9PSEU|nr:SHOCT domain-containing protein [Amycolatopsis decaplanina]EME53003.1 integral membrane protein [Amycolatopsis decaplanina DSM 44594]